MAHFVTDINLVGSQVVVVDLRSEETMSRYELGRLGGDALSMTAGEEESWVGEEGEEGQEQEQGE